MYVKDGGGGGAMSHRLSSLRSDLMNRAVPWRRMISCYSVCVFKRHRQHVSAEFLKTITDIGETTLDNSLPLVQDRLNDQ